MNPYFSCCLVFIILARYYVHDIYGYVARIGSFIDWEIASVVFKGWLRVLPYLGCSSILFFIWLGKNSLNITAWSFFTFSSNCFSVLTWLSIWVFYISLKDSFSNSTLIGSYSVNIFLIRISLLKYNIDALRIDSAISLPFKNSLWIFKIRCSFTLVKTVICWSGPVPFG